MRYVERPFITITSEDVGATEIETNLGLAVLPSWAWPIDDNLVGRRLYGTRQEDGNYRYMLESCVEFEKRQLREGLF